MSYTVGVLCQTTHGAADLAELLRDLVSEAELQVVQWRAATAVSSAVEVDFPGCAWPVVVQATIAESAITPLVEQAERHGLVLKPGAIFCNVELIISGEVDDWESIIRLLQLVTTRWDGLLHDEESGFAARLE